MNKNYISGKKATEILGLSRQTLHNYDKNGYIETIRSKGGKRFYNVQKYLEDTGVVSPNKNKRKICYARVSTYSQKEELENQKQVLMNTYPDHELMIDIGSGINFKRKNLSKIIKCAIKGELKSLVVTYKDRLCRIGYDLIKDLLEEYSNTKITILYDEDKSPEEEVVNDLIEIITVFSSKIYGLRSYKKEITMNKNDIINAKVKK